MDRDKFATKGHAYRHDDLTIYESNIHPNYQVEFSASEVSSTGRMVIFKLRPKSSGGPRFEGRWDNKQEELDVDAFEATDEEIRQFKAEACGYAGHHNGKAKFGSSVRTYTVKIVWPGQGTIFEGEVNFKVHRRLPAGTGQFRIN
ncbi:MAG: hypothetical protein Q7T86_19440 [Hyphomicrobiaceae bacterium]|nr:hypothetical protein [Hyphomicrobiaceae bacterium]